MTPAPIPLAYPPVIRFLPVWQVAAINEQCITRYYPKD